MVDRYNLSKASHNGTEFVNGNHNMVASNGHHLNNVMYQIMHRIKRYDTHGVALYINNDLLFGFFRRMTESRINLIGSIDAIISPQSQWIREHIAQNGKVPIILNADVDKNRLISVFPEKNVSDSLAQSHLRNNLNLRNRTHINESKHNRKPKQSSFIKELQKLSWHKWSILVAVFCIWLMITPYQNIACATYFSSAFIVVETVFCSVTEGRCQRIILSTPEQFIANILFVPTILPEFNYLFSSFPHWERGILLLLFCWVLEIIEGNFLIFVFRYNRAWQYEGSDAFFNGTIKLSYAPIWILFGLGAYFCFGRLIDSMHPVFSLWIIDILTL